MSPELPRWAKWSALGIGGSIAAYYVLAGGNSGSNSGQLHEADFDNFLVRQGDVPTGMAPSAGKSSSKKKKGRSRGGNWLWGSCRVAPQERGQVSGPFETFLKVEEEEASADEEDEDDDHRNPLDFNSFLKAAIPGGGSRQASKQKTQESPTPAGPAGPRADQARVLIMYGTEFGFSKEIAEKLCDKLREANKYWCVQRMSHKCTCTLSLNFQLHAIVHNWPLHTID
jgi:hypothetical protein